MDQPNNLIPLEFRPGPLQQGGWKHTVYAPGFTVCFSNNMNGEEMLNAKLRRDILLVNLEAGKILTVDLHKVISVLSEPL